MDGLSDHTLIYTHVPVTSRNFSSSDFMHYSMTSDTNRNTADPRTTQYTPPNTHVTHTHQSDTTPSPPIPTTTPHTTSEEHEETTGPRCQQQPAHQKPPAGSKIRY